MSKPINNVFMTRCFIGSDAEVRDFGNGNVLVTLQVAQKETWKDGHGNQQEKSHWYSLKVSGKQALADYAQRFWVKGQQVNVQGHLVEERFNGSDGTEVRRLVVDCTGGKIEPDGIIKGLQSQDPAGQQQRPAQPQAQRPAQQRPAQPQAQRPAQQRPAQPQAQRSAQQRTAQQGNRQSPPAYEGEPAFSTGYDFDDPADSSPGF